LDSSGKKIRAIDIQIMNRASSKLHGGEVFEPTAQVAHKRLKSLGSSEIAIHSQRFFKTGPGEYGEGDVFIGVRVPVIRKVAKEFRDLPLNEFENLLRSDIHEERLLALVILVSQFKKSDGPVRRRIYDVYLGNTEHINNWDLVDVSAPQIVGAYLEDRSRRPLYRLVKSSSLWERRIAILATFHFIRQSDFDDTIRISTMLIKDKEDLIHKAVGWMLREVGKRDLSTEEAFLNEHAAILPRTMLRYAIEKFSKQKRRLYIDWSV
jgi:3-methyladenine DNA glycosylase AlkD